jgi:hypothetical protein
MDMIFSLWDWAKGWADVFDHLLLVGGAILVALVPSWFAARNHKGILEVKNQVKNAHTTNLRDDLDRAIVAIEDLAHDVRGLRQDLAAEEGRRRQQVAELREDLDRRNQVIETVVEEEIIVAPPRRTRRTRKTSE